MPSLMVAAWHYVYFAITWWPFPTLNRDLCLNRPQPCRGRSERQNDEGQVYRQQGALSGLPMELES